MKDFVKFFDSVKGTLDAAAAATWEAQVKDFEARLVPKMIADEYAALLC